MIFQPTDERTHRPGTHRSWNESLYFNFFDSTHRWSGAFRIAFSPNWKFADGFVCLYFPDGTAGFIRTWESLDGEAERNSVGALRFTCVEPFQEWRLQYDGPLYHFTEPETMLDFGRTMLADVPQKHLALDLTFSTLHPPFDFHDAMRIRPIPWRELRHKFHPRYIVNHLAPAIRKIPLVRTMAGGNHYEQAGHLQGTLRIDEQTFSVDGLGQRDHSWGVRDMRVPTNWRWLSCQFGEELCFNAIQVDVLALRVSGGYVYHAGQLDLVTDWVCTPQYHDRKLWAKSIQVAMTTRRGKRFDLRAETDTNIPVLALADHSPTLVTASRGRYEWQGQTADGMIEFMEQLL